MIYHGKKYTLNDLPETIEQAIETITPFQKKFTSIVVIGMSGVIVGVPVSLALNKPLVIIRKDTDESHHGNGRIINEKKMRKRCLFLDDFMDSGHTWVKVKRIIASHGARITCAYMYNGDEFELL